MFTRQLKVQIGKSSLFIISIKEKGRFWREMDTAPSVSSYIDRVFSESRGKKYGSNPSEEDIKVVTPAPTK